MKIRFTSVRFGEGYDAQEVDDFIDRCERAVRSGDGSVTAEEVTQKRFTPTRFREGYDMEEVDRFLDDVLVPLLSDPESFPHDPQRDYTGAALTPGTTAPRDGQRPATMPERPSGSALHPAERRPGFFARLFGGGR